MSLERPTEGDTEWTTSNSVTTTAATIRDPVTRTIPPGPIPSEDHPSHPLPSSSSCRYISSSPPPSTSIRDTIFRTKEQNDAMRQQERHYHHRHHHHHHHHGNNNSDATLLLSMTSSPSSSSSSVSSSWYDPGHSQNHNMIPSQIRHHHDDEDTLDQNAEDDEDRLNRLFHHDKDYVDLPPKQIRNFNDDDDNSNIRTPVGKTSQYSVTDLPPTKLRSFSEPEVSRHMMDTAAVLHEETNVVSPNVLRHRFSNRTTTNNLYPHHQQQQQQQLPTAVQQHDDGTVVVVGVRGRSYTADHCAYAGRWSSHVTTREDHHVVVVARTAFHSSWEDDHDDDGDHSLFNTTTPASSLTNHTTTAAATTTATTPTHGLSHPNNNNRNIDTLPLSTTSWSQMIEEEEGASSSSSSSPPLNDPLAQPHDFRTTANDVTHHHHTRSRAPVNDDDDDDDELELREQQQQSSHAAARRRWLRINRRFQMIVAVVVVIFSILVFGIFLCWIVWAGTFFQAEPCQVQLKRYFWLATLQLVLGLFRTCLLRVVFRWNPRSPESIPGRVMAYYIVYLIYAACVLRLGIASVFSTTTTTTTEDAMCQTTAPDFFHASTAFVSLSLAAWMTIIVGYLIPFCVVAVLLTINGYNPNTSSTTGGSNTPPFPFLSCGYTTVGAPPGCVDQLRTIELQHLPGSLDSKECCICMEAFIEHDVIVITKCEHIFHKQCCREWLRQASTCPVCREDIPSSLEQMAGSSIHRHENEFLSRQASHTRHVEHPSPPPPHLPASNLLRVILDARNQLTDRNGVSSPRGARISPILSSSGFANDIERG